MPRTPTPSVKQIEALYWSGVLGSFVSAAARLNTTQSNISKRIQELETAFGYPVFDRSRKSIRLTPNGEALWEMCDSLLRVHGEMRSLGVAASAESGLLHIGVTETVALTWLPRLCEGLRDRFPNLTVMTHVSDAFQLNAMLQAREVDLVIAPRKHTMPDAETVALETLRKSWLASPRLVRQASALSKKDIAALPLLSHRDSSAADNLITRELRKDNLAPRFVAQCNSLSVLAKMAIAGMGMTYFYADIFREELANGQLRKVETVFPLPQVNYVAAYRDDPSASLARKVALLAKDVCDFSQFGAVKPPAFLET